MAAPRNGEPEKAESCSEREKERARRRLKPGEAIFKHGLSAAPRERRDAQDSPDNNLPGGVLERRNEREGKGRDACRGFLPRGLGEPSRSEGARYCQK